MKIVSAYRGTSFHSLLSFSWDRLVADLALHAPIPHTIVSGCVPQHGDDSRCNAVIGMVVTVLLKSRNRLMCAVPTVFSLILNEGHTNKQVITGTHIIYLLLITCNCKVILFLFHLTGVQQVAEGDGVFITQENTHLP